VVNLRPIVTGLSANSGSTGSTIFINGQNFSGAAGHLSVFFGNTPAGTVNVLSDTQLSVVVPNGSGTVAIAVQSGVNETDTLSSNPNANINAPIFGYGTAAQTPNFTFTAAPAITLSVSNPLPFPEGASGTMMFVVARSGDTAPAVQVNFATQDGTAHAGTDYVATAGTLSFGPGETMKTIPVPIIANTMLHAARSFTVTLSNPLASAAFASQDTFATGTAPVSVAVADFNGDGKPDLVVANDLSNKVSVLLNTTVPGATTHSISSQHN
jgi:hypothetical protein